MKESDIERAMNNAVALAPDGLWYAAPTVDAEANRIAALLEEQNALTKDMPWRDGAEIPVTEEMIAAGNEASASFRHVIDVGEYVSETENHHEVALIFRAMAAVAPRPLPIAWTKDATTGVMTPHYPERERIVALEAENATLRGELMLWRAATITSRIDPQDASQLHGWLVWWPKELPVPYFYGAAPNRTVSALTAVPAPSGSTAPVDIPDPPRRSDGTLAPQGKPWTPPKPAGDPRRVGG